MAEGKKNRAKRRPGVLDILIVLAVVAGIILAVKLSANRSTQAGGGEGSPISFQVELTLVPEDFSQGIQQGDKVYDSKKGGYLGVVQQVEMIPYKTIAYDRQEQTYKEAQVEGAWNALVTIQGNAQLSDRTTTIGNVTIAVGTEMYLKSAHFARSGYCVVMDLEGGAD